MTQLKTEIEVERIRSFEEESLLIVCGLWCYLCKAAHPIEPSVMLRKGDSIRLTCSQGYVVTFKVEDGT